MAIQVPKVVFDRWNMLKERGDPQQIFDLVKEKTNFTLPQIKYILNTGKKTDDQLVAIIDNFYNSVQADRESQKRAKENLLRELTNPKPNAKQVGIS